jgi:hypothetical protein
MALFVAQYHAGERLAKGAARDASAGIVEARARSRFFFVTTRRYAGTLMRRCN